MSRKCTICGARNRSNSDTCQACRGDKENRVADPTPEEIRRMCDIIKAEHIELMRSSGFAGEEFYERPRVTYTTRHLPVR